MICTMADSKNIIKKRYNDLNLSINYTLIFIYRIRLDKLNQKQVF